METLDTIIADAHARRASDVHIAAGVPIRYRVDGELVDAAGPALKPSDTERLAREATGDDYAREGAEEHDLADTYADGIRCRLNIYRSRGNATLAIRLLADEIPTLSSLNLPPAMLRFPSFRQGVVIVTGETGSGKSTTLASEINEINKTKTCHIITLEDPIEYLYTPDRSSIDQREVGKDTRSFADGLRAALREDPDVILVGEMRDLPTIETALIAAETGHLVFGTLHTRSAPDSVDRLVGVFPAERQRQIRMQLSMTLTAVVSQQLLVRRGGEGRVVACEVMIVNDAIRNLIRESKTPQIANAMATGADIGSVTMDNMLVRMVRDGVISPQTAVAGARDCEFVRRGVR